MSTAVETLHQNPNVVFSVRCRCGDTASAFCASSGSTVFGHHDNTPISWEPDGSLFDDGQESVLDIVEVIGEAVKS